MARQLTLIPESKPWRLSERTREIGRKGIAEARAALAQHHPENGDNGVESRRLNTRRGYGRSSAWWPPGR